MVPCTETCRHNERISFLEFKILHVLKVLIITLATNNFVVTEKKFRIRSVNT
jgi:hypothetical protein